MLEQFTRTSLLFGEEAIDNLENKRVAVFGVGGVGGYVCEALVRTGIGAFDLIDKDVVSVSNINRQIIATLSTVGKYKTEVMKERMLDINPNVKVNIHNTFFLPENSDSFPFEEYDYVVDCVDTVTAKIELIMKCKALNIPIISAMGAGNKLDPTRFKVANIYDTTMCPLAKVMRHEMKKRGIKKLKVVFSDEKPIQPLTTNNETHEVDQNTNSKNDGINKPSGKFVKQVPGSNAFVPAACGLTIASEVIKDLVKH